MLDRHFLGRLDCFIIYLICQKRQGDTKKQSLYKGVSLEDTKPITVQKPLDRLIES